MATRRPQPHPSLQSPDQSPAPQGAASIPHAAPDQSLLPQYPPAYSSTSFGSRPPICAARFASPLHSSINYNSLATTDRARAASFNAPAAFTRAEFAKLLVRQQEESGYVPQAADISQTSAGQEPHAPVTKKKIGIIGAGMAGLYAALILDSLRFDNYEILEANPERVGGRVFTHYFEPIPGAPATKWNYVDYGAMRFPSIAIMDRVIGMTQPWSLVNYLNAHVDDELKITLLDYNLSVDNNIHYYNSTRKTSAEIDTAGPDPLHFGRSNGGGLADKYVERPYWEWLDPAFDGFKQAMHDNFDLGFQKLMEQDHFSVRAYLRTFMAPDKSLYPQELIDYLETLNSATGHYDDAFTEAVMASFDFDSPTDSPEGSVQWKCIQGGTSQLSLAMLSIVESKPELNKKVIKIAPSVQNAAKSDHLESNIDVFVADEEEARHYEHVINTVPPGVLRSLDTAECNFSYAKRTALRILRMDSSLKIGLQFKTRWWQDEDVMKGKPIRGGQSSTDLPIRTIVYPSYGINDEDAPGVLIASYAWAEDAARLSALAAAGSPAGWALVELCMSNLATVHNLALSFLQEQFTRHYYIQDWDQYEYSQGAFALFGPGQFTTLFPGLKAPEMNRRYHTAGEMSSVHHAWIVGALNSAWRCVYEILRVHGAKEKIAELVDKWGLVEEVDMRSLR